MYLQNYHIVMNIVRYIKEYEEQLYHDYKRTEKVKYPNTIIECLCGR